MPSNGLWRNYKVIQRSKGVREKYNKHSQPNAREPSEQGEKKKNLCVGEKLNHNWVSTCECIACTYTKIK